MRTSARGTAVAGLLGACALAAGAIATLDPDPSTVPPQAARAAELGAAPSAEPSPPAPSPAPAARVAVLPPADTGAPLPTAAGLQAAVAATLADRSVAGRLAVSVVDAETGEVVLERGATTPLIPASTAKIATAVAALTALDPQSRIRTRVLAGARPGEVVLVGGGDPTLASAATPRGYPAYARLTDLAARTRAALGATRVTRVLVDESLYTGTRLGPGWRPAYVGEGAVSQVGPLMLDGGRRRPGGSRRVADPALSAGKALAALLAPGVPVSRGTAAPGAAELAAVASPTVAQLVERMLARSDNDLAEALARQVAVARGRPASFQGAAAAVAEVLAPTLAEAGVGAGAVALADGSGLSRSDRVQPAALTRLLARAGTEDRLAPVLAGLPVAGFDGTLARRFRRGPSAAAAGAVRAKTGTLDGVSALAGLVRTADGRLLAFDLTADGVPLGSTRGAEAALDRLAAALASCGCR